MVSILNILYLYMNLGNMNHETYPETDLVSVPLPHVHYEEEQVDEEPMGPIFVQAMAGRTIIVGGDGSISTKVDRGPRKFSRGVFPPLSTPLMALPLAFGIQTGQGYCRDGGEPHSLMYSCTIDMSSSSQHALILHILPP